jgi:hypothetical protein
VRWPPVWESAVRYSPAEDIVNIRYQETAIENKLRDLVCAVVERRMHEIAGAL